MKIQYIDPIEVEFFRCSNCDCNYDIKKSKCPVCGCEK